MRCLAPILPVLLASAVLALPAQAEPLTWAATEVSLEAPPMAESVEAAFTFTNAAEGPVTIQDIHSSCGCTVPSLEKRTYAPGESGTIRALFTIGERVGLQEKVILVTTADPLPSQTALTLRVQIPKLFEISPYFVIWNGGEPPTAKSIDFRLLKPDLLSLDKVESRHANFTAELKPVDGAKDHYTIAITPRSTDTPLNGAVVVSLRSPDGTSRQVALYALVRSAPIARPAAGTAK